MCITILKMMMKMKNISHRPRSRHKTNTRGALV